MISNDVYLIGAGGHSKQVTDILVENGYTIVGIFDDCKKGFSYLRIPILGTIKDIEDYSKRNELQFFCTIGDNNDRARIVGLLSHLNLKWINCVSKHAYLSPTVTIGSGNYIGVHTRILSDTHLGSHNIINDGATLTHDNSIGNYNHIAPAASLGGGVGIGDYNLIGTNATINPYKKIDNNIIIGSGAVVTKDLRDAGTYVGIPAVKSAK